MELLSADRIAQLTGDQLDSLLERIRVAESQLKAVQMRVLREVDHRQIPLGDGMRTLEDWIVGRLDVTPTTARKLVTVARTGSADLDDLLADGVSFDRVTELAAAGDTNPHLELDLPGLRSMLARRTPVTAADEQASFDDRFLAIQPSLDDTAWSLWGKLGALEGKHIADTLDQIADELPTPPHGHRESRATRRADALFMVCDRHNPDGEAAGSVAGPTVPATVFIDVTHGSTRPGAWIASGPRVGPSTLERILCGSPIDVIALTADGEPLKIGNASTQISPATRRFVVWRDGGMCTADGCGSTYRLQPHHITERSDGGDHRHTNLTSLCWYHHHIVIHGRGFRIDPTSPTRRRRFLPPARSSNDPPI
jgi:hypothetical protein